MALFDTLKAAQRLTEAGFDEEKAGAIVSVFSDDFFERLATKADLRQLEERITERLTHMEERLEQRFTIRMGVVATAATGVILTAIGIATGVIVSL